MFHLERKLVKWNMTNSELEAANKVNGIAKAIFYFVLLLFLPGVLGALQMEGISEPFSNALSTILAFIPKLFAAALIVLIGWLIAIMVRDILTSFLKSTGTENLGQRFRIDKKCRRNKSIKYDRKYRVYLHLNSYNYYSIGKIRTERNCRSGHCDASRCR